MKRFFLILILLFPVLTLGFWVYRGVHTPKTLDEKVQTGLSDHPQENSSKTNLPGGSAQTNH